MTVPPASFAGSGKRRRQQGANGTHPHASRASVRASHRLIYPVPKRGRPTLGLTRLVSGSRPDQRPPAARHTNGGKPEVCGLLLSIDSTKWLLVTLGQDRIPTPRLPILEVETLYAAGLRGPNAATMLRGFKQKMGNPAPREGRCARCQEWRIVSLSRRSHVDICRRCYRRHEQPPCTCAGCARVAKAQVRREDGTGPHGTFRCRRR